MDAAFKAYKKAEDHASIVRMHIMKNDVNAAMQVAMETSNPAACFHLARQLEGMGNIKEAINYYAKAHRFNHAVNLAMEQGMDNEVYSIYEK